VAGFVFELFQIQRRHGIYGSPDFTLPILSLLTYEGMIKDIYPEIDFLQEAVPFVMASLAVPA
jgi:ubiquinone biosynthesis protein